MLRVILLRYKNTQHDHNNATLSIMTPDEMTTTEMKQTDVFQDQSGSNDKADKFGDDDVDYEYANESGGSSTSDTSRSSHDFIVSIVAAAAALILGRVNL